MGVNTSTKTGNSRAITGYKKDVYFGFPGADSISKPITVTSAPIHIIAPDLPPGCLIGVERLFNVIDGKCDPNIPPATVYCEDGCSPLYLFNVEDPNCPDGRRIQNEIWLFETGHYQLIMEGDCDPEQVFVWGIEDPLVRDMFNCNIPLRGQLCLPDCVSQHVILMDGAPSAPPDCTRCEDPIGFDPNTGCMYFWTAPLGSNCQEGEDNGYWEELCPAAITVCENDPILEITSLTDGYEICSKCAPVGSDIDFEVQPDCSFRSAQPVSTCENDQHTLSHLVIPNPGQFLGCCIEHTFPGIEDVCDIKRLVLATDPEGCQYFAVYEGGDTSYGGTAFNSFTHTNYPANTPGQLPTDFINPALVYNDADLYTDDNAGAGVVNNAKVIGALLTDATFVIDCPGLVRIVFRGNRKVTAGVITKSHVAWRWSYDAGVTWEYARLPTNEIVLYAFSSTDFNLEFEANINVIAGNIRIQSFFVTDDVLPPTELNVNSTPPPAVAGFNMTLFREF